MTKDEALRLAWDALEDIGDEWGFTSQRTVPKRKEALTAIKESFANEALDKMAENAKELGLDYEPPQPEHGWTPERIAGMARLKEAQDKKLAQPEQEPVAWAKFSAKGNIIDLLNEPDDDYTPLYTNPPQRTWVGLTLDERIELAQDVDWAAGAYCEYAEKIEAKLKEKNNE